MRLHLRLSESFATRLNSSLLVVSSVGLPPLTIRSLISIVCTMSTTITLHHIMSNGSIMFLIS